MIERDYQILLHIRKNCNNIISYQKRFGDSFDDFSNDDAYRDAVSMCIMQIGELANGFSDDFCKEEQFPYKEMRGMRNVLAHNYLESDKETIWTTTKEDIPQLLAKCSSAIQKYESDIERSEKNHRKRLI